MEYADGEAPHHDLIFIGFLQRRGHHPGLYITSVYKEVLIASAAPAGGGLSHIAGHRHAAGGRLDLHHFLGAGASHCRIDGGQQLAVAGGGQLRLAVPEEPERDLRVSQRLPLHRAADIASLYAVPLQELHPGGGIIEQIPNDHGRPLRAARRLNIHHIARLYPHTDAQLFGGCAGQQVDLAHGADSSQCLAPEAHGRNAPQILRTGDFGCGMAQKGCGCVFF